VLFCDLVGYTRLSSVLDPEDVHALLQRLFALVDATVERFGGTIDKHIGDATMALFGAPLARGNDAERAVRAALEIQTAVPALASGLPFSRSHRNRDRRSGRKLRRKPAASRIHRYR
jgi:class 3 adenylate cyclase